MTQAQHQFQRPLLRIGSILFIAGMVIAICVDDNPPRNSLLPDVFQTLKG